MEGNDDNFRKYLKNYNEETDEFENQKHIADSHGSEIKMFYEEKLAERILSVSWFSFDDLDSEEKETYKTFMKLLQESLPAKSFALKHNRELVDNKPIKINVSPNDHDGLSILTAKDDSTSQEYICSIFPFFTEGIEYKCRINSLLFNGDEECSCEGQIEAFIDEEENLLLTFFDIHFIDNKNLYNPNDIFKFTIMGLATEIDIINNDDMISLEPKFDLLSEEYYINTVVRNVKLLDKEINGEKVWKLSVVIGFTSDGEDIPLDIYTTVRSLRFFTIPKEGDNIRATVSLHGYLTGIEKQ